MSHCVPSDAEYRLVDAGSGPDEKKGETFEGRLDERPQYRRDRQRTAARRARRDLREVPAEPDEADDVPDEADGVVEFVPLDHVERTADWVTVRLRDDGDGIPPERQDQLFDTPQSGDHGYGLFLTNNLVEMYDGHLELGTTGPEGTEFVVRFPAAAGDQPDADASGVRAAL